MLQVLRPRLSARGHAVLCHSKRVGSGCARRGRRRLSTTSEPSKPAGSPSADEEPGWPLKYKLAGGAALGTIIPWMFSYAVANDPGSRRLIERLSPELVQWFRNREQGGHFFDEDPKRVAYVAQAPEWIDQPVTMEVRTGGGETRCLQGVDARTPFSAVGGLVHADGSGGTGGGGRAGWLTDFDVLDEGETGDGEVQGGQATPSSWEISSGSGNSSGYQDDDGGGNTGNSSSSSSSSDAVRRAVAACNVRSWWDIAAMEEERARQPAPPPLAAAAAALPSAAARGGGSSSAGGVASVPSSGVTMGAARPSHAKKMSSAEQAQAMIEHLEGRVESLEQDKLTGARSVDDVEEEVRDLRKQQKELRRKHPGRRRFLGLF